MIHFRLILLILIGLSACNPSYPPLISLEPESESLETFENEYLKFENGLFTIKKTAPNPILIKRYGSFKSKRSLADISFDNITGNSYLLLPEAEPLVKLSNNPFKDEVLALSLVRPSIWGQALVLQKIEHSTALFKIGDELQKQNLKELSAEKYKELVGEGNTRLGQGAEGEVLEISYKGQTYGLKTNANEASLMEKLQFTDGVAKIYAMFSMGSKPYMVMEKGKYSLDALTTELNQVQVIDAVKRFERMIDAQEILNIKNLDIKPQNLLITKDDRLVVIDINEVAGTYGFDGTAGEMLARALLENQLGMKFKNGMLPLYNYYDAPEQKRRDKIASPDTMSLWVKFTCEKLFDTDKAKCTNINNFEDFFRLLSKSQLQEITQRMGNYNTINLTMQRFALLGVQDVTEQIWETNFSKNLVSIGRMLCQDISIEANFANGLQAFYQPLKSKYEKNCKRENDTWIFEKNFKDSKDPEFRAWFGEALLPVVKFGTFLVLAHDNPINESFYDGLIKRKYDISNDPIGKAIFELYQYKAKNN